MTNENIERSLDCARGYATKLAQHLRARRQRGDSIPTPLQHQHDFLVDFAVDWWPHAPAEKVREVVREVQQRNPVDGTPAPTKW